MSFVATPIPSPERERWLENHVPYRIQILRGLAIYKQNHGPEGLMRPVFPCIFEASLMACRWAAAFLGLRFNGKDLERVQGKRQHTDDVFVVDLGGTLIDPAVLPLMDRNLLATVFRGADKASAHPVREGQHSMTVQDVVGAAPLLISKINVHLYGPLGLQIPEWR